MKTYTHAEWLAEGRKLFGPDFRDWKFVCPACGTVQTPADLLALNMSKESINNVLGYSCIGRFTGKGDEGIAAKNRGETWTKGCNWTLGGLLHIHTAEVVLDEGAKRPVFEFATGGAS